MLRSPLHSRHEELGARFLPFAGWEMPIQYDGIVAEHRAVRNQLGVFDISHMGEFLVSGKDVTEWLNGILTNDVRELEDGQGQYTLMLNEAGGAIDDLILYREAKERYFLVVNASKIEQDEAWLKRKLRDGIVFENQSAEWGALAVQGPKSTEIWNQLEPKIPLPNRNGIFRSSAGAILCRTGYTGEDGFELFDTNARIGEWFDQLLAAGAKPCGLGARDTLRLEKCYPLNGSDLDEQHTPLEAGLGFFVKLAKVEPFVGQDVLLGQKANGVSSKLSAIKMTGKSPPPRHGYEVRDESGENQLGELTSGSLSPSLGIGIGMAYLAPESAKPGTPLTIAIRDRVFPAEVVKKPFL